MIDLARFFRLPTPARSADALRRFLARTGCAFETASPAEVMAAVVDFYGAEPIRGLAREPDADMLVFQYGCHDWGRGEHFQLSMTRQFLGSDREQTMSQLRAVLYFAADDDLRALGRHGAWCGEQAEPPGFRAAMLEDRVFQRLGDRQTVSREIAWGKV